MKIIDLLNKIANGEEVPKKIKWEYIEYEYSECNKDYLEFPISNEEYQGLFNENDIVLTNILNDEVEIMENPKKIEKINSIISNVGAVNSANLEEYIHILFEQETQMKFKLDEIIDYINKGECNEVD